MKPMLCANYDEERLVFPLGALPKIDGVRALNMGGSLVGRSLKPFKNRFTVREYSHLLYDGFDGEMAAQEERHPALCRLTTSALNSIQGEPFLLWHLFDWLHESVYNKSYIDRHYALQEYVAKIQKENGPMSVGHLRVVPLHIVHSLEELLDLDSKWLNDGYEGTIIRALGGKHKQGRSTVREGGYLRIKRFEEKEAHVIGIIEGRENLNEAQTNELGRTYRTSHQENQIPNGMVGALECIDLETGNNIIVSAGSMPHSDRVDYFQNPFKIVNQIIKYKTFLKGVKDKPRFPTFQSIRMPEDMSE